MPKNASKTGKSSKTARVLSLLTDPAASLLGGSRNHRDEDEETTDGAQSRGLDDAATESRIQASLAAEEDSLVTELFGKKEPARPRAPEPSRETPPPPSRNEPEAAEPDPRTLELLSMLSNPSTLGNSAMPMPEEPRPAALDMDFADELTEGMPAQPKFTPEPEPPAVRPYVPQQLTQQPQARQPQPVPPQSQARQPQPAPSRPQPAKPQPPEENNDEFVCFNLTQAMVEEKADKLMKQFGMCTCNRCKVDVTAIALTNLPAKYVVTQNKEVLPLLSMYEERYSAAVTVQVMNACRMVMKRPHHGR